MHKPSTHVANPDDGYEVSDVKVKLIVYAGIAGVLATLGSIGVSFMYTKFLVSHEYVAPGEYTPVAPSEADWSDPVHLQGTPEVDLKAHRAHSEHRSADTGAVSESPEVYYIPLDEAITLVVDKGTLPTFKVEK